MEVSIMTPTVCFLQTTTFISLYSAVQRNYPGRICSRGKKEIRTAYKYSSEVLAGEGGKRDEVNRTWELR